MTSHLAEQFFSSSFHALHLRQSFTQSFTFDLSPSQISKICIALKN